MPARRSEAEARISFMVVTRDPDKAGAGRCEDSQSTVESSQLKEKRKHS
jgi:hypothetical protein